MQDAANPSPAGFQMREDVLSPGELERIDAFWKPANWPHATDALAKAGYQHLFGLYLERIRHLGLSGALLVDAGCGGGQWSFAWATKFDRVIGFDTAPQRIVAANWQKERLHLPAVEFITGDVRDIPAADQSVDALYCNDVISHIAPIEPVLHEFFRVLKPGGVCYIGLPGLGLAYEHATSDTPPVATLGRKRIYNTLCGRHLMSLVGAIGPGWAREAEAAACLQRGMPATDLLFNLNCRPDQIMAAETIADDLGEEFSHRLLEDLTAINAGRATSFGEHGAGRVWNAEEVTIAATEAGFGRIEWGPDGWLSLKGDGSVEKAPPDGAMPGDHEFEGRLRAFEMLLWKPPGEKSEGTTRLHIFPTGGTINTTIKSASRNDQKLTLGKTTYWNPKLRNFSLPIIESEPPTVTELEEAIITPRYLGRPGGASRISTGGIYDRNRNLLPPFLERESYENAQLKFLKSKNEPVLSREKLANAQILKGTYIYLGIIRNHFGHFLLETLSHIWYLLKNDSSIKVLFHQYEHIDRLPAFSRYIFSLFGLTPDRIVVIRRVCIVERLLFPESEFEIRWKSRQSFAGTFRELVERNLRQLPTESTPRNIYFTRRYLRVENSRDGRRVVDNEEDVEALFAKRGFAIIAPEKLPIHEQIANVAGADQIAGMKGSALHMSLFCQRPNARLIQIGSEQLMNQTLIDGLKNMESHQILCGFTRAGTGSVADLEIIDAALRQI